MVRYELPPKYLCRVKSATRCRRHHINFDTSWCEWQHAYSFHRILSFAGGKTFIYALTDRARRGVFGRKSKPWYAKVKDEDNSQIYFGNFKKL